MRYFMGCFALLAVFLGGCATPPPPGASGEVKGPLWSIELYTSRPDKGGYYSTFARHRFYQSDREVWVGSRWSLPDPGEYVSKVTLNPPSEGVKRESEYRFRAERGGWITYQRFSLPTGDEAKSLAGKWRVEVALNGSPVGTRSFQFDAASIRLRTAARLLLAEGSADHETATGNYVWRYQYAAREAVKSSAQVAGRALRDELSRRFPDVTGPGPVGEAPGSSVVLNPLLRMSPNPSIPSRMELEIRQPETGQRRLFTFKSTAGSEFTGGTGTLSFDVAGADLGLQAGLNPEVLDFLIHLTNATPE
jgi:hypothetical protein